METSLYNPNFKERWQPNVANYRSISLLCTVSKILEDIVFLHISEHFLPSLSVHQFGFTQGRSILQQLLSTMALICTNSQSHITTNAVYLDLRNCVPHDKLMSRMWSIWVAGTLWRWIRCYLSCRFQLVTIDGIKSAILPFISGVP